MWHLCIKQINNIKNTVTLVLHKLTQPCIFVPSLITKVANNLESTIFSTYTQYYQVGQFKQRPTPFF